MDRRSFIGLAISALVLEITKVADREVADFKPLPEIPPPNGKGTFTAKVTFGPDLAALASVDRPNSKVDLNTPWLKCHLTGRKHLNRTSTLTVSDMVCPLPVMKEIMTRYGDVTKMATNEPVTLYINDTKVATLTHACIQQIGYMVQAQDVCVVTNLQLVGVWQELSDAMDKYTEAQRKEQEALDALKPKPTQEELDKEAAELEAEYAYRDSQAYYDEN